MRFFFFFLLFASFFFCVDDAHKDLCTCVCVCVCVHASSGRLAFRHLSSRCRTAALTHTKQEGVTAHAHAHTRTTLQHCASLSTDFSFHNSRLFFWFLFFFFFSRRYITISHLLYVFLLLFFPPFFLARVLLFLLYLFFYSILHVLYICIHIYTYYIYIYIYLDINRTALCVFLSIYTQVMVSCKRDCIFFSVSKAKGLASGPEFLLK